jgi:hypothetical protein
MANGFNFKYEGNLEESLVNHRINILGQAKRPKTSSPYIGIEFEFFSEYNLRKIQSIIAKFNLQKICTFKHDGSIRPDQPNQSPAELVALIPQKYWKKYLRAIMKCLTKCKAQVNDSCGLHVHIDHRLCTKRNPMASYLSLQRMQDLLFQLVKPNRRTNRYCSYEARTEFFDKLADSNRYSAINLTALRKFRSIEVRLFHGTLEVLEIMTFVNCLLFGVKKAEEAIEQFTEDNEWRWQANNMLADNGMPNTTKNEMKKMLAPSYYAPPTAAEEAEAC